METQRKLASIRKIDEISQIENADNLEAAKVGGWVVVVRKGEFHAGDLAVYCEIDSFLPIKPEFEFLRKSSYKKMGDQEGFRLKSIRLRGVVSQGLLLPVSVLEDQANLTEGLEVTEQLGIQKYEAPLPACLSGIAKGNLPEWVQKTDEERCQNLDYQQLIQNGPYVITEKLDGSSVSIYLKDAQFGVCSRNLDLKETEDNTYWKVVRDLKLEERMRVYQDKYGHNAVLQGELIGSGIQKNRYGLQGHSIRFFTGTLLETKYRLNQEELEEYLATLESLVEGPKLETVPVLDYQFTLPKDRKDLIAFADGESKLKKTPREGIVLRSTSNPRNSLKVISNLFLLKNED